ncbi:hypothetical protein Plhal710r2_c021g0087891 [Plasmopara halstedii]
MVLFFGEGICRFNFQHKSVNNRSSYSDATAMYSMMAIETLSPLKKIGSVKAPSSKSSVSKSSS